MGLYTYLKPRLLSLFGLTQLKDTLEVPEDAFAPGRMTDAKRKQRRLSRKKRKQLNQKKSAR